MQPDEIFETLQARTRKLRADLELLAAEIHAQIAENERHGSASITDENDAEEAEPSR